MQNRTITAFFDVTVRPGRVLEYAKAGAHGLGEHGWHELDKRTWRCRWAAATWPSPPTARRVPVGLREGATENKTVARHLLADLVGRGLDAADGDRRRRSPHRRV